MIAVPCKEHRGPDKPGLAQGLADERLLILTHPEVAQWMQRKSADPERGIRGMRKGRSRSD